MEKNFTFTFSTQYIHHAKLVSFPKRPYPQLFNVARVSIYVEKVREPEDEAIENLAHVPKDTSLTR